MAWVNIEGDDGEGRICQVDGNKADAKAALSKALDGPKARLVIEGPDGLHVIEKSRIARVRYGDTENGPWTA